MAGKESMANRKPLGLAGRIVFVTALAIAVAAAVYFKPGRIQSANEKQLPGASEQAGDVKSKSEESELPGAAEPSDLPRLVDLGADKCIPCKMMAPILAELRQEYEDKFEVVFIDVWKNRAAAKKYGVRVIPTQIFYDDNGIEIYRHQGFFSKKEILKIWDNFGYDFGFDCGES
jgi:thioredoxin 1